MNPEPRSPRIFEVVDAIERAGRLGPQVVPSRTKPDKPVFTVKAQLERSLLFEEMIEKQAQLETFRVQEVEFRSLLCAAMGRMAYSISEAQFRIETRQWNSLEAELDESTVAVTSAKLAHLCVVEMISSMERDIADSQRTLDDAALWEEGAY